MAANLAIALMASPDAVVRTRAQPDRELDGFQGPVHGVEQVRADRADVNLPLQAHEAAWPLARAAGDRGDAATALLGLAYVAMFTGDGVRAAALAEEGLAEARASGDQVILAQVLFFLSWVASNGAGFERAGVLATEALSLFTGLGDTSGRAEAMFVLGTVALYSARYAEAVDLLTVCLNLHRDCGAEPITARDLGGLGS